MVSLISYLNIDKMIVERVRRFINTYNPRRIYVLFSAGKDSTAALLATAMVPEARRRMIIVYNELVGNTHPINVETTYRVVESLVPEAEKHVVDNKIELRHLTARLYNMSGPVFIHVKATNRHGEDFWKSIERWGIPVRLRDGSRWCYNEFKEKWWRELYGVKRYFVVGVKMTDSWRRKKLWQHARDCTMEFTKNNSHDISLSPICDLTDDEVWYILEQHGLAKYLKAYELAGDSLNCVFCPLRSLRKQKKILQFIASTNPTMLDTMLKTLTKLKVIKEGKQTLTAQKARELIKAINEIKQHP